MQRIFASKGLDAWQTAFAIKKYKSRCHVGLATEVVQLMEAQMALTEVPKHFRAPPQVLEARFHLFRNLFQILKMQK